MNRQELIKRLIEFKDGRIDLEAILNTIDANVVATMPPYIRDEMYSDMHDNGMRHEEIVSLLNYWSKKYIIKRR